MKKIIHISGLFVNYIILMLALSACGNTEDPALISYHDGMSSCCERINELGQAIDAIDPSSADASAWLLTDLDHMNEAFSEMAALEAPAEYKEAGDMAFEASALMNDAVSLYHDAYAGETPDSSLSAQARSQYLNAMEKLSEIGSYFSGD